jgi:hypothetical protein
MAMQTKGLARRACSFILLIGAGRLFAPETWHLPRGERACCYCLACFEGPVLAKGLWCGRLLLFLVRQALSDFKTAKKPDFVILSLFQMFSPLTHTSGKLQLEDDHAYKKICDLKVPLDLRSIVQMATVQMAFLATVRMSTRQYGDRPDGIFGDRPVEHRPDGDRPDDVRAY